VHRATMRVIDGMHRLEATRLRNETEIEVRFYDGDEADAFILAVQVNAEHGLPLTLADRTAAAGKILEMFPDWSDRAIARTAGLAAGTVGAIRRRVSVDSAQLHSRLGTDGRRRPVNTAEARRQVRDLISRNPGASLREIAGTVGVSTATVRDVRRRLAQGRDPVPDKQLRAERNTQLVRRPEPRDRRTQKDARIRPPDALLDRLRKDPSLRFSEAGRTLLRWLTIYVEGTDKCKDLIDRLPPHSPHLVLELARSLAQTWMSVADELEKELEYS
jgi:transposase-like protein